MSSVLNNFNDDTICAIATAMSDAGIGIIRVSGKEALTICDKIYVSPKKEHTLLTHKPNTIKYGYICNDQGDIVDEVMISFMKGPHSYTREDVAEIQSHGGTQVLQSILASVLKNGARLAEPGEFTRRAFLNGRIDLSRAEAVMSLISARGEQEQKAAVRQMNGGTAEFIRKASDRLYHLQAGLAACIDYPEEISDEEGAGMLRQGLSELTETLNNAMDERSARLIHDGMQVTLFGTPNAGKSSLLNALIGQEKAIVTDIPGTTRDTVEGEMILDGIRVHLTDTAGMRNTDDPIERIGVERSEKARQNADAVMLILDGSRDLTGEEQRWILQLHETDAVIVNKSDLPQKTTEETVDSHNR